MQSGNQSLATVVPQVGPLPLVSVVIPAYNAAALIPATLDSVFAQTFRNFEVVLINDGSPDTPALEHALEPYRSRINYISQRNAGPSNARNRGIREARGKYVAFLDSDDLWLPHHLAVMVETLQQDPALGLVYADALHLAGDRPIGTAFDSVPQSGPVSFETLLVEQCTVNTSSTVASRQALLDAGLFDEQMNRCEDYDLWLRMAQRGTRMAFVRDVQICHRRGNGLAADRERMKRGRAHVYDKMAAVSGIAPSERAKVKQRRVDLEAEIQMEIARSSLLAGNFAAARSATDQAKVLVPSTKLHLTAFGLRVWPSLLRVIYRGYVTGLSAYKNRERTRRVMKIAAPIAAASPQLRLLVTDRGHPNRQVAK
jgi:glycosyltransferase involved in cell wall biosynthesis